MASESSAVTIDRVGTAPRAFAQPRVRPEVAGPMTGYANEGEGASPRF
jgi:hypothetical protein